MFSTSYFKIKLNLSCLPILLLQSLASLMMIILQNLLLRKNVEEKISLQKMK